MLLDAPRVQSNIVVFGLAPGGAASAELCARLKRRGVLAAPFRGGVRFVTHRDVSAAACRAAADVCHCMRVRCVEAVQKLRVQRRCATSAHEASNNAVRTPSQPGLIRWKLRHVCWPEEDARRGVPLRMPLKTWVCSLPAVMPGFANSAVWLGCLVAGRTLADW